MRLLALTRAVSPAITRCELTHMTRSPIDHELAVAQHRAYERCLERAGCRIVRVPPAPELPDAVFVEDTAVVLDEAAIVARPGAVSRRPEVEPVADALRAHRPLRRIRAPGTLDGGDVLRVGRTLYVGISSRTNVDGRRQLEEIAGELGYEVRAVELRDCLHLKTAATAVADRTILVNPAWVEPEAFAGLDLVEVDPDEPFAANALRPAGDVVVHPEEFPRTRARLERRGIDVWTVPASELAKAEGGVTCCSIVVQGVATPERAPG